MEIVETFVGPAQGLVVRFTRLRLDELDRPMTGAECAGIIM